MDYPYICQIRVNSVFKNQDVKIAFYSPITVFVGANGLGKTQTLKSLRDFFRTKMGEEAVRYLSSNRMGNMEKYRSRVEQMTYAPDRYTCGGKDDKNHRHVNETVSGDFFTMDEKKDVYIKVAERLSVLFKRQIFLRWDSGRLTVYFAKNESQEEYSVAAEASGLVNIISILSALYDDSVHVLLVDEPEVSLHPQLQSFIMREMQYVSCRNNKTIILSTHSSNMIPFDNITYLCNIVFFTEGSLPRQVSPETPEMNNRKLKEFILRMSQIYKEGFFAKKVLLIEGASDNIICRFLLQKLNMNIDVAGTQIIPVDGKGQFPAVTKLFRLIGKEVYILADLDAFTDDNTVVDLFTCLPEATEKANERGINSLNDLIRDVKNRINELIADDKYLALEEVYKTHPYWKNKERDTDKKKYIIRSIIAILFSSKTEEIDNWPDAKEWKQIKIRMEAIFNYLEELGCYFLRLGAIESYYMYSPNDTYDEKPSKAADEVEKLQDQDICKIRRGYSDIIRALEYVSEAEIIDEGFAVKKELLSEIALALEILSNPSKTINDILAAIKQSKGSVTNLFKYEIVNEKDRKGIKVDLCSNILEVTGFPLTLFVGDNVNEIISKQIKVRE